MKVRATKLHVTSHYENHRRHKQQFDLRYFRIDTEGDC